jgi:hypothetical protein
MGMGTGVGVVVVKREGEREGGGGNIDGGGGKLAVMCQNACDDGIQVVAITSYANSN